MEERWRVMALDYGTKRIGVAISDELRMLATARGVIENTKSTLTDVLKLASSESVRTILVGLPKTLQNTDSQMTKEVRTFTATLRARAAEAGIAVVERDERLTSVMANDYIAHSALPRQKRQQKALRDEEAARIVLQEYLDQQPRNR